MKRHLLSVAPIACAVLLTFGCANPADDKPAAEVGEAGTDAAVPTPDTTAAAETAEYRITEESEVGWTGSKVTGSHDGAFEDVTGTITLADGTPEGSTVDVVIDTTTITSDTDRLTEHLKSPDFFDVEKYPEARFTSTSITPNDDGTYTVTGDLTLHGVTKQIRFPAEIEVSDDAVTADAEFSIQRFDWDISYKGKADDLIRDEVVLRLDVEAEPVGGVTAETGSGSAGGESESPAQG